MCRTTVYMRPTNTVNNEQQDVRGISVITPLPTGEGMGEGPVGVECGASCCGGGASCCRGLGQSVWLLLVHSFGCACPSIAVLGVV